MVAERRWWAVAAPFRNKMKVISSWQEAVSSSSEE
jgi:hypothetical protein